MKQSKLNMSLVALSLAAFFMAFNPANARSDSDKDKVDINCNEVKFDTVQEYCDEANNNPYSACESDIDDHYVAEGYSDPDVDYTETIADLAARTSETEDVTRQLVCHGTGSGGGGGN